MHELDRRAAAWAAPKIQHAIRLARFLRDVLLLAGAWPWFVAAAYFLALARFVDIPRGGDVVATWAGLVSAAGGLLVANKESPPCR